MTEFDMPEKLANFGGDSIQEVERFVPEDVRSLYETYSFRHAAAILANSTPGEFAEVLDALRSFRLTKEMITSAGGNESDIPKAFNRLLRPKGWYETRIHGDLHVHLEINEDTDCGKNLLTREIVRPDFLDGHKVDYVKNRVAFDLEWNSKDQTFDRDLYAARAFYDCDMIDAAILTTRSGDLNSIFSALGVNKKYGASTTWMGKLLYRLKAGRNGGCPLLIFGIRPGLISDWKE